MRTASSAAAAAAAAAAVVVGEVETEFNLTSAEQLYLEPELGDPEIDNLEQT